MKPTNVISMLSDTHPPTHVDYKFQSKSLEGLLVTASLISSFFRSSPQHLSSSAALVTSSEMKYLAN